MYFDADPVLTGDSDLYIATRPTLADPFGAPVRIDELATLAPEADPWLSPHT